MPGPEKHGWVVMPQGTGALRAQSSFPGDLLHLPPKTAEGERGGDGKRLTTAEWLQVSPFRHPRAPGVLRRTNTRSQLRPAGVCPAHVCTLQALSLGWDKRGGQAPRGAIYTGANESSGHRSHWSEDTGTKGPDLSPFKELGANLQRQTDTRLACPRAGLGPAMDPVPAS